MQRPIRIGPPWSIYCNGSGLQSNKLSVLICCGRGSLRDFLPSKPERALLLFRVIGNDNSANNGEAFMLFCVIIDMLEDPKQFKVIPWEVDLTKKILHTSRAFSMETEA